VIQHYGPDTRDQPDDRDRKKERGEGEGSGAIALGQNMGEVNIALHQLASTQQCAERGHPAEAERCDAGDDQRDNHVGHIDLVRTLGDDIEPKQQGVANQGGDGDRA